MWREAGLQLTAKVEQGKFTSLKINLQPLAPRIWTIG